MKTKSTLFIVTCLVMLMNITSLYACDPKKKNKSSIWLSSGLLWARNSTLDIYDGGWGFPQSVEVNTYDAECYPWLSGNGRFLLFASINFAGPPRPGHQGSNWDIYISEWDDVHQCWGREKNIAPPINTVSAERRPSCTWNGDTLYFNRWVNGQEDIFVTIFDGSKWSMPLALPAPVNTDSTNDEHPAISADGKRLYFTSKRRGGFGGSDVWVALWDGSSWGSVINFGPPVNTFNEESRPFESYDGKRLYFTSHGGYPRVEGSYGAGDIYVCTKTESGWGPVQLLAAPVNCDLEACSPYETPDGKQFWIGSEAWEGAQGDEDIWVAYKGSYQPRITQGYGKWIKTGELEKALYVYDLKEGPNGIIYAATACADSGPKGKVYKTNNGGLTWTPCGDLPGSMTVYTLIVQGDTLYAGTYPNGDVFKSTNRGNSWINTADIPEATSARSLLRLENGDILVGTSPPDLTNHSRIFRTSDGGLSWNETARLLHLRPCKFIYQTSSNAIFTGGWSHKTGVIIYKSIDNGVAWDTLTVIPDPEVDWGADRFCETHDGTLFVGGHIPSQKVGIGGGYVSKSHDQGESWNECSGIIRGDGAHSDRIYTIIEDRAGTLYAGIQPAPDSVVFASSDGGNSWYSTGGLDGAYECLCLLQASNGSIYAGTSPNGDIFRYNPTTSVEENHSTIALQYQLAQNYPNPFNSTTAIRFQMAKAGRVTIKVYNVLGQKIKIIEDDYYEAGWHEIQFDGLDENNTIITNGAYLYSMEAANFISAKKFLFFRR
jgi:hypothetical protein